MGALRRRPVPVVQFLIRPTRPRPRQAKLEAARPIEVGDNA
jgi:hypothetical protein